VVLALQVLDGLATLANHTPDHAFRALHGQVDPDAVL
jgi:hypothetical protein